MNWPFRRGYFNHGIQGNVFSELMVAGGEGKEGEGELGSLDGHVHPILKWIANMDLYITGRLFSSVIRQPGWEVTGRRICICVPRSLLLFPPETITTLVTPYSIL